MQKTKFYALLTGNTTEVQQKMERVFDKKSKKFFNKVTQKDVKRNKTLLFPLEEARTRAEANLHASELSKQLNMPLQGVHAFK